MWWRHWRHPSYDSIVLWYRVKRVHGRLWAVPHSHNQQSSSSWSWYRWRIGVSQLNASTWWHRQMTYRPHRSRMWKHHQLSRLHFLDIQKTPVHHIMSDYQVSVRHFSKHFHFFSFAVADIRDLICLVEGLFCDDTRVEWESIPGDENSETWLL